MQWFSSRGRGTDEGYYQDKIVHVRHKSVKLVSIGIGPPEPAPRECSTERVALEASEVGLMQIVS